MEFFKSKAVLSFFLFFIVKWRTNVLILKAKSGERTSSPPVDIRPKDIVAQITKLFSLIFGNNCNSFIIPNELPSLLSIIYSNIPPVKVGFDTRFGLGFRLGPHADYQTLIEIGPQTNTNPLSSNGTVSKRQSNTLRGLHRLHESPKNVEEKPTKNSSQKRTNKGKKVEKTVVGKIEFKKIPGIDDVNEKVKILKTEKPTSNSLPTKFVLL